MKLYYGLTSDGAIQPEVEITDEFGSIKIHLMTSAEYASGAGQSVFKSAFDQDRKNDSRIIYAKILMRNGEMISNPRPTVIFEYNQIRRGGYAPREANDSAIRLLAMKDGVPVEVAVFDEIQLNTDAR